MGRLSVTIAIFSSLAISSPTGSHLTGGSAKKEVCEGEGTFNTLSSVINSFSPTTSCCTDSTSGDTNSSVSVECTLLSSSVADGINNSMGWSTTKESSSGLISF